MTLALTMNFSRLQISFLLLCCCPSLHARSTVLTQMQINLNLNAAVVRQMFQMKLIFQISIQIQKHADLSRHLSMPFLDVALLLARTPRVSICVTK